MAGHDDAKRSHGIPAESTPPRKLDAQYVRRKLESLSQLQAQQARVEAERVGASRTSARILAAFGALFTAAAIAGFSWVWSTDARVRRLEERQAAERAELEREAARAARRIEAIEQSSTLVLGRLDRLDGAAASRHEAVMSALRARARRRVGSR